MKSLFSSSRDKSNAGGGCSVSVWLLVLSNLLVFQLTMMLNVPFGRRSSLDTQGLSAAASSTSTSTTTTALSAGWDTQDPLAIPKGQAVNLPSIRVEEKQSEGNVDKKRKIYGGAGDKAHLGGFTDIDTDGISPNLWRNMMLTYGVRSLIDLGCGRGISTRWFYEHKVDVLCVEGSHDAVEKTFLPMDNVVEHDFSRGPWWPAKTYDAVWCIEFLEHVSRQYHFNYMQTLRKAALIFVSSSKWGGWHHVEVHPDSWWIQKFEAYGFRYSQSLTDQAKGWAMDESKNRTANALRTPNGKPFRCTHCIQTLKVFVNPTVAALPDHQHLFPRDGCFERYSTAEERKAGEFYSITRPCGKKGTVETALPDSYKPLSVLPEMHAAWDAVIRQGIQQN